MVASLQLRLLTAMVALLVIAACSAPAGATPSADPDPAATQGVIAPTRGPAATDDCFDIQIEVQPAPMSLEFLHDFTPEVSVGTFGGYGEAFWNTPDGQRPTRAKVNETTARLIRPVLLQRTEAIKGSKDAADQATVRGGTLGCDRTAYSDDVALKEGQEYVFFFAPVDDSAGGRAPWLTLIAAFAVEGGKVLTMQEGPQDLAVVKEAVLTGKVPTLPPIDEPFPSGPG